LIESNIKDDDSVDLSDGEKEQEFVDFEMGEKLSDINTMNRLIKSRAQYFQTHIIKYAYDPFDQKW